MKRYLLLGALLLAGMFAGQVENDLGSSAVTEAHALSLGGGGGGEPIPACVMCLWNQCLPMPNSGGVSCYFTDGDDDWECHTWGLCFDGPFPGDPGAIKM